MKKYSGYIEGYYGRLLSWDDREKILSAMKRLSLDTYVYGPKEDIFHRLQWKRPYPREWIQRFTRFVKEGKKKSITVVPCLSPGLSYGYCSVSDYKTLVNKFNAFIACGAETVGLFMDDIPEKLPINCMRSFPSLGHAHAVLLSRLLNSLRNQNPAVSLWFCPTVYCDFLAKNGVKKSQYLRDLSAGIPKDIPVFWTGQSVISKFIDRKNIAAITSLFSENIIIWDNLYANDYCPNRLFVGPYRGRQRSLLTSARGICLNPTGLVQTDMMLLGRLSAFVNKKRRTDASRGLINGQPPPGSFTAVSRFFDSPFAEAAKSDLVSSKLETYQKALKRLLHEWKSSLQREWYPFLFMLDRDVTLLKHSRKNTLLRNWIDKYYSPVLSFVLTRDLARDKRKKT